MYTCDLFTASYNDIQSLKYHMNLHTSNIPSLIKQESIETTEDYDESGVKTEPSEDVSNIEMKISQPHSSHTRDQHSIQIEIKCCSLLNKFNSTSFTQANNLEIHSSLEKQL